MAAVYRNHIAPWDGAERAWLFRRRDISRSAYIATTSKPKSRSRRSTSTFGRRASKSDCERRSRFSRASSAHACRCSCCSRSYRASLEGMFEELWARPL